MTSPPASTATSAPGETSLPALLSTLTTILHAPTYVFVTLPHSTHIPSTLTPDTLMTFRETEGTTLITTQSAAAAHGVENAFPCRMITLAVHSSLEAVGFMAAVTAVLAQRGIGVNPVSGFFHDHLFVPEGREVEALEVLGGLAREAKGAKEGEEK